MSRLAAYAGGTVVSAVAHVLDLMEDSISLNPSVLLLLGMVGFVTTSCLMTPGGHHPAPLVTTAELLALKARHAERLASFIDKVAHPPGIAWRVRALSRLIDTYVAGQAVYGEQVDTFMTDMIDAGVWWIENNGQDPHATERQEDLVLMARWRDSLPDSPDGNCPTPSLGARIRMAREAQGWTQQQLGDRIGRNIMTVNRLENDQSREPSVETRRRLAKVLGGKPADYTRD